MKVSCLCPTFGRVPLLEEALECFLKQDYKGEKELVVCNDCDRQTLVFDHPEVKIHNVRTRFATIGAKRNHTAGLATGDLLLTWGDDDIHLPGRISRMVEAMDRDMLLEGAHYCLNGKLLKHPYATCGAHMVKSEFFWRLGGVPEINMGEDVDFNLRAVEAMGEAIPVCREEPQFIYRWASGRAHASWGPEHYGKMGINVHSLIARGEEPKGEYHLRPHWKMDYVAFTQTAVLK